MDESGSEQSGERRQAERIPINDEFSRLGGDEGSSWVSDLSLTGVFVHSPQLLPVGSEIELRFTVLAEDPVVIEAVGKIVRHSRDPRGMGVQFTSIEPDMRQRIETVMSAQRPLDSGSPLRLPEPAARAGQAKRSHLGRAAPTDPLVGSSKATGGSFESAVTGQFPRVEPKGEVYFRPPPRSAVDEDDRTRKLPKIESE